jgi:hypothetical protein
MHWYGTRRGKIRAGRIVAGASLLFCLSMLLSQPARAEAEQIRRILIVNEAGVTYPAIDVINQGIRKELENSPYKLEFYSEYLETILFPDPATQQKIRAVILYKYQNRKPDVIIAVGPSALQFLQETHKTAFSGIPSYSVCQREVYRVAPQARRTTVEALPLGTDAGSGHITSADTSICSWWAAVVFTNSANRCETAIETIRNPSLYRLPDKLDYA